VGGRGQAETPLSKREKKKRFRENAVSNSIAKRTEGLKTEEKRADVEST